MLKQYQEKLQTIDQRLWVIVASICGAILFVSCYSYPLAQQIYAAQIIQSQLEAQQQSMIVQNHALLLQDNAFKKITFSGGERLHTLLAEVDRLNLRLRALKRSPKFRDQNTESYQIQIGAAKESIIVLLERLLQSGQHIIKTFEYKKDHDMQMEVEMHDLSVKQERQVLQNQVSRMEWLC